VEFLFGEELTSAATFSKSCSMVVMTLMAASGAGVACM